MNKAFFQILAAACTYSCDETCKYSGIDADKDGRINSFVRKKLLGDSVGPVIVCHLIRARGLLRSACLKHRNIAGKCPFPAEISGDTTNE